MSIRICKSAKQYSQTLAKIGHLYLIKMNSSISNRIVSVTLQQTYKSMKKTLIALLTLSSIASAVTATTVTNGSITLDGTQATDTRLDFTYSTTASQVVTTTADLVNIAG